MIQYEQLQEYFALLSKIVWDMPVGRIKYKVKRDLTELDPDYCGDEALLLSNMIDRANHSIKLCFHRKQAITKEDLQKYVDKLIHLAEYYEVSELDLAIEGLQNNIQTL